MRIRVNSRTDDRESDATLGRAFMVYPVSPISFDDAPAAMASAIQPASMATPPIGVIMPSHLLAGDAEDVEAPREHERARQEQPAGRVERRAAPAGLGHQADGQDREGAVHLILRRRSGNSPGAARSKGRRGGSPATRTAPAARGRRRRPSRRPGIPRSHPIRSQKLAFIRRSSSMSDATTARSLIMAGRGPSGCNFSAPTPRIGIRFRRPRRSPARAGGPGRPRGPRRRGTASR